MITEIKNSPRRHNRRSPVAVWLLAVLALLTLAGVQPLAAQEQERRVITTIIPWGVLTPDTPADVFESGKPVLLRFRADALPKDATVVTARLRLTSSTRGESGGVTIRSFFLAADPGGDLSRMDSAQMSALGKPPNPGFGDKTLTSAEPDQGRPWAEWTPTNVPVALGAKDQRSSSFALLLLPSNLNDSRKWYSISAATKLRPRLILEYTVPGLAALVQTEGVRATHSPKRFLPSPAGAQFSSRAVSGIWNYAPVFYKDMLYLISQDGTQLQALSALGGPPVWSVPLTNPGQHLLRSETGRLYIVGKGQILAYQLNPSNPGTPATEVKTSKGQPLNLRTDLNPDLAPAVGADGSLYFIYLSAVYGLNPDLQEMWEVTLSDKTTSRVAVGPSGQFIYLTAKGEGLIALDAQTGERVPTADSAGESQSKLADSKNITFHAPVVVQHPDGTEKIYVAANSSGDGVLAYFNNSIKTVPRQRKSGTIVADRTALPGLWSQPIPDQLSPSTPTGPNAAKKIYAVRVNDGQGSLTSIDWLAGPAQPKTPTFPVSSDLLNTGSNGGNLAIDQDGNVFVWNGTDVKLYAFTSSGSVVELPLVTSSGLKIGSRLAFGSDGTLYAAEAGNAGDRTLRAIVPQYTVDGSRPEISSPTHLRVDGTVTGNTTLSAPGSVFLGNGFTVKQGATLTIKTKP